VLERSLATIHDETGLRPRFYNTTAGATDDAWAIRYFGAFREFENREVKWYPGCASPHDHATATCRDCAHDHTSNLMHASGRPDSGNFSHAATGLFA
jgi:hypothetical protein